MAQEFVHPLKWTNVAPSSSWEARADILATVFKNKLWIFGGVCGDSGCFETWNSKDGIHWELVATPPVDVTWTYSHVVSFKDKVWQLGGDSEDGTGQVRNSTDGLHWTEVIATSDWSARYFYPIGGFKDKLWILGGSKGYRIFNDIWSSKDGVKWKQEVASANWGPREGYSACVFDNKIFLMGGSLNNRLMNDVWCTEDGVHWAEVTASANWKPRMGAMLVVFKDRMWMIGGGGSQEIPSGTFQDIWSSLDGKTWVKDSSQTFLDRYLFSATVFKNHLFIYGGMKIKEIHPQEGSEEYLNDVWMAN